MSFPRVTSWLLVVVVVVATTLLPGGVRVDFWDMDFSWRTGAGEAAAEVVSCCGPTCRCPKIPGTNRCGCCPPPSVTAVSDEAEPGGLVLRNKDCREADQAQMTQRVVMVVPTVDAGVTVLRWYSCVDVCEMVETFDLSIEPPPPRGVLF